MSLFPIRCFTCGKVISNKLESYKDFLKSGKTPDEALDTLRMSRMCCRRMFLGHPFELEESLTLYPPRVQKSNENAEDSD